MRIITNAKRLGAAQGRIVGAQLASNDYILFCDDDESLEAGYALTCLRKLKSENVAAVSGRRVFKRQSESVDQALMRFGNGLTPRLPFNPIICEFADDAYFTGDIRMPLTNSVILTPKRLIERFGYDPFYSQGNGYREESDYQMNLYVNGLDLLVTNAVHSIHLHRSETRSGGSRVGRLKRVYWATFYTNYFYAKYWDRYAARMGLTLSRRRALALFCLHHLYAQFIRPARHFLPDRLRFIRPSAAKPIATNAAGSHSR